MARKMPPVGEQEHAVLMRHAGAFLMLLYRLGIESVGFVQFGVVVEAFIRVENRKRKK